MDFSGKKVLVAGGGQGIGFEVAQNLASRGAHVILLARRQAVLDEAVAEIRKSGGSASAFAVDLTDPEAVSVVTERIRSEYGCPDIFVHTSGGGRYLSTEETDPEEAVQMMATRYFSVWYVLSAFIDEMIARDSGHIVIVGSSYVWMRCSHVAYIATHHALYGMASSLRHDLFDTKLHVMWVEPPTLAPDTAFFTNNPGTRERLPRYFHSLTKTPSAMAEMIVKGIERRRWLVTTFPIRFTSVLYKHLGFSRLIDWFNRSQMPTPAEGGPISGWRSRLKKKAASLHMDA